MVPFSVAGLTSVINQLLPEPHAGLLAGLLFGTKASLPRDLYDGLVTSGTLHIVALSGMNISILGRMVTRGLQWLIGKRGASLLTLFLILWFVWFVSPSPSIVRAAIMGSISILAVLFGRQYWALLSWVLAVGVMLLLNPSWLFDISFQLSSLATLGIIVFGGGSQVGMRMDKDAGPDARFPSHQCSSPPDRNIAPGCPLTSFLPIDVSRVSGSIRGEMCAGGSLPLASPATVGFRWFLLRIWELIKDDLRLTLAAQTLTIPIILFHFHRISWVSPVANLAIGWVIPLLTGLGWAMVLVGWVCVPLGQPIAWVSWVALEYLVRTVYFISSIPFASSGW